MKGGSIMDRPIRVLVVEDDNDINQLLCQIVKKSGYDAQPAFSGTEAMLYLENQDWDLILLDLMLPGMSGEEILSEITTKTSTPVMIISAKDGQKTKVSSLRSGADDFIVKPFDVDEVAARIESVLRRTLQRQAIPVKKELIHKDIRIDLDAKTVYVNDQLLSLTAREYELLVLLMSTPKKVYSKANLFESVWKETYYGDDNIINVHMSHLRQKLRKANPHEDYIETVWGMGYRMKS